MSRKSSNIYLKTDLCLSRKKKYMLLMTSSNFLYLAILSSTESLKFIYSSASCVFAKDLAVLLSNGCTKSLPYGEQCRFCLEVNWILLLWFNISLQHEKISHRNKIIFGAITEWVYRIFHRLPNIISCPGGNTSV